MLISGLYNNKNILTIVNDTCTINVLLAFKHGWDHKHGHYQSRKLSYQFLKLQYQCWELSYQFFGNVTVWGKECQNKVDTIWYKTVPFEISWNYIITCFSSPFVLDFCTQNDIKLNIFESNWHKIEITICKSRFCVKIEVNQYFVYKMIINWQS